MIGRALMATLGWLCVGLLTYQWVKFPQAERDWIFWVAFVCNSFTGPFWTWAAWVHVRQKRARV